MPNSVKSEALLAVSILIVDTLPLAAFSDCARFGGSFCKSLASPTMPHTKHVYVLHFLHC